MNKGQLVKAIAQQTHLKQQDVDSIVTAFCQIVTAAVADGGKVTLVGFGSFQSRQRQAREGRNPQTGEPMKIPATVVPVFCAGKEFKDRVAS